ncbi:protein indeterminate-domain 5, chloroplastic-like [Cucurbita maxima]|uniref:Protein indeterminate-domain 5, chloroplastic-like n=1 Tax=Cucurbita maxima TaxID=3661 RepID=A0A6J1HPQ0_CUCMA|nr:protein indeterminate-domain 5, chloroplastic-like [Cucurbita maxima]
MAASSSSVPLFGPRDEAQMRQQQQQQQQQLQQSNSSGVPPPKKKRNQPGTPNPDAEVIALSPKTLMATNRFICEVCNKGFQREQNLQLHRRGHNLPWKLKQKSNKEPKRKVYLCPEPTCVHHDPSRALGDLTGIKKHYSRKHGEKKWKCDKCSKRYAVQSDWKAHSKTCGTREYRCDCGTLFSRRDSFITHRAFCDALAQESARHPTNLGSAMGGHLYGGNSNVGLTLSQVPQISSLQDIPNITQSDVLRLGGGGRTGQFNHLLPPSIGSSFRPPPQQAMPSSAAAAAFFLNDQTSQNSFHEDHGSQSQQGLFGNKAFHGLMQFSDMQSHTSNSNNPSSNLFNLGFISNPTGDSTTNMNNNNTNNSNNTSNSNNNSNSNSNNNNLQSSLLNQFSGTNNGNNEGGASNIFSMMGDQMNSGAVPSLYSNTTGVGGSGTSGAIPHMSATALLQKAAQLGSTTSSSNTTATLLRSFGSSSTSGGKASDRTLFPPSYGGVFGENESNLQDLMNSFTTGSSAGGLFGGGMSSFGTFDGGNNRPNNMETLEDPKLQQNLSSVSMGGTDRLTRDFLGVGQIVRSMSSGGGGGGSGGGYSQREHKQPPQGIVMDGNESNSAATSQAFGGGGNGNYQ